MYIINDTHIGTVRVAGTTPKTQLLLRKYLLEQFSKCLDRAKGELCILGDLFDTHTIAMQDVLETYRLLDKWLDGGYPLYLVAGNHDLSTDSSKLSSFQFMAQILAYNHPGQVHVVQGSLRVGDTHIISHVPNQDLFNLELERVEDCKYLLVHANYDNNFAKESDHSLNLSEEVARKLPVEVIFFAHEHQGREHLKGKVFVAGNQFPASISDCLGEQQKFMHKLTDSGITRIETWNKSEYCEMPWDDLEATDAKFVRLVGRVEANRAAEMADVVARYRRNSEALIVGNAVKVGDETITEERMASLEKVQAFDVMGALKELLKPEQIRILENLT